MSQEKKSTVGDPIWVESLMSTEEHAEAHKKYPTVVTDSKPKPFNPNYHKGGKWRAGMGAVVPKEERDRHNKFMEELIRTKVLLEVV